jgi:hypothetical protein
MAHFAKLDANNLVIDVHVVNNDVITVDGQESEQAGIDFLTDLLGHSMWKQASYSGAFRKRMAAIGYTYNPQLDAFIPPKDYQSFIFDEVELLYVPPIAHPNDGKHYYWCEVDNEGNTVQNWVEYPTE